MEQGASGAAWQLSTSGVSGSGHTVKMIYTLNNATSFSTDSINGRQAAMYYTTINSDFSQTLTANGYYPASSLTVTITEDENWVSGRAGTVEEYKDIDGHVVLKRQYNYTGGAVQMLSTYYVYDDLGRLAFVLPPESGADGAGTISSTTLNNLCYQYQYDERGRPIQKKLPGKGWEYTVYNQMDQPVATQDALVRNQNEWTFTKYDDKGRVVMTGLWNNGNTAITRAALKTIIDGITTNLYESPTTTGNGYTNVAWPTTNVTTTLSINYYDGYIAPGLPSGYTAPTGADLATRGQLTATQTNVLNTSSMLWSVHYYDYWGRNMESYTQHYFGGTQSNNNFDAISTTYSFFNSPTTVTRKHWNTNSTTYPALTVYNRYTYDVANRKKNSYEQLTNANNTADTLRVVSTTNYNEAGQLWAKKLDSKDSASYQQTITYAYNERGWLLQSTASLFAMVLYYNTAGVKAYNGNIMFQYWGTPGNMTNHYSYTYDKLNRLLSGITAADNYQESGITYDQHGNISTLNRYQAGTEIDQLSYSYTVSGNLTNQLQTVVDANVSNSGLVSGTTSYSYDVNGNMASATNTVNTQQNKSFTYNILNLPSVVTVTTGTATYSYDATGNKLRKVDVLSGTTTYTDYIGGIQYNGTPSSAETISFVQTEEGKAVPIAGTGNFDYNYYLGDNLGNTRLSFDTRYGIAKTLQQDDYYPFGLEINRTPYTPKNEYLYNRKELQEEFTEYDYGARFYDPIIGGWNTVDPLAEDNRRQSTYNYVSDNPIRLIDPDGMDAVNDAFKSNSEEAEKETDFRINLANAVASAPAEKKTEIYNAGDGGDSGTNGGDPPGTRPTAKQSTVQRVPVPKNVPKKSDDSNTPPAPEDQGTIKPYPDPHDVNNQDLGNPNTSATVVTGVVDGYPIGEAVGLLRAGRIAFTTEELTNIAFHSGPGMGDLATSLGYSRLGLTEAGIELAAKTEGMAYKPGTWAYQQWAELSIKWAESVPRGSSVTVFLNNPEATSIWIKYEEPILKSREVIINIYKP